VVMRRFKPFRLLGRGHSGNAAQERPLRGLMLS
jgi:hypothetical protein